MNDTATKYAYTARMSKAAAEYAASVGGSEESYLRLKFLHSLKFVIDNDLSDEIAELQRDLGMDAEGYPLTDGGDRDCSADRVFVPALALRGAV